MNILVTGANGFIGQNLMAVLDSIRSGKDKSYGMDRNITVYGYDRDTDPELLDLYCKHADFVFNLAGVNRPEDTREYMEGNFGFASTLLKTLKNNGNTCPVMLASSTQAALDNPYGKSKRAGEDLFLAYGKDTGARVYVYRFTNVFGKWCRPDYNSAVATFCYNIARGQPITVNNPHTAMNLVYIDDLVEELIRALKGKPSFTDEGFCFVPAVYRMTVGGIADLIRSFSLGRELGNIPDMTEGGITKKLYSTYLSYLPTDGFSYPLKMNKDHRGSFTEVIRTSDRGQFSVNISKPGITKGNHWHHTKCEKFIVVSGTGLIRLKRAGAELLTGRPYPITEYPVSGEELTVVDIVPGYTHSIINTSRTRDLVTLMWCNECFNPEKPDTYALEVEEDAHE